MKKNLKKQINVIKPICHKKKWVSVQSRTNPNIDFKTKGEGKNRKTTAGTYIATSKYITENTPSEHMLYLKESTFRVACTNILCT